MLIPGVVAPKKVVVLTPVPKDDPMVIVANLVGQLATDGETRVANKIRNAVIAAAPRIGEAIADATEQLAKVLEDKSSTKLEIIKAKAAVADAAAQTILTVLKATNGNIQSLALPVTSKSSLPEVEPGEALIITPTGTKPAQTKVVDDSTIVMTSKQENLSLAMSAVASNGNLAEVNAKGAVQAALGQSLAVTGSGFKPKSKVAVWMFSSPRSFGFVTTDANGSFAAEVPMPDNIPPGDHTAQINGQRANGETRSLNLGLEVGLEETPPATVIQTTTTTTQPPRASSSTSSTTTTGVPRPTTTTTTTQPPIASSSTSSTTTTGVPLPTTTTTTQPPSNIEQFIGATMDQISTLAKTADNNSAALLVDGKAVAVGVRTTPTSKTLTYKNASLEMKYFDKDGSEIKLSDDNRSTLRSSDTVTVTATGFLPESEINVAVFSDPVALGTVVVNSNGEGTQQWGIPDTIVQGNHTLVISGDLVGAANTVFGLPIVVNGDSFIARVASSMWTRVFVVLGILGGLLVLARRRRRNA